MMLNEPIVRTPTSYEQLVIRLTIVIGLLCMINFCVFFFRAEFVGHPVLYGLLSAVIVYGLLRDLTLWYHYLHIQVPPTPTQKRSYTVDVLTTYYPGEPYDMIVRTLTAIQAMTYPHTTYLCDEADDDYLKEVCKELGVVHVSRQNRVNAKAGNINNALRQATGEICLILDPDHIPETYFLDFIVPHFQDPRIGFVQTVQAYYNKFESIVAKGSAQQTFHFYGPMMMCMNTYGTVNAIGANCTFRRAALDSIGGHAPGLAEDMHTAMLLYREGWKSVYVPRILAKGLVPSTMTAYFKQQLKWARGTFDLLVKVYPRIFSSITWRQRLHYLLIPVHYLAGIAYLLGFLIPILSLFLSEVPWTGNFGFFLLIVGPVVFSSFVIRFYIQKWLISDDERGFHIVGGVLEIITWWVFTLGFVYTLFNKKVPYLPTPKNDEDSTHISLLVPNLVVAALSLAAVAYGLQRDLTPYSLIMAGFALLNTVFMLFSVYLSFGVTNRVRTLRRRLPAAARNLGRRSKRQLLWLLDAMTITVRTLAPALLVLVTLTAFNLTRSFDGRNFERVGTEIKIGMHTPPRMGLFYPTQTDGLSDLSKIEKFGTANTIRPEIISSYVAWSGQVDSTTLSDHLAAVVATGADPMITWEPWVSHFPVSEEITEVKQEERALHYIAEGEFDGYIEQTAKIIRRLDGKVYLRFAHEFDNPAYPWSHTGHNTPEDFKMAWRHVFAIFNRLGVENVVWVWNPWQAEGMAAYYPGDKYVDLVGLTVLNYGPSSREIPPMSFTELYTPFRKAIAELTKKGVLLAEFGSLGTLATKAGWVTQALDTISTRFPEVYGIVAFNSPLDKNIPREVDSLTSGYLDWSGNASFLFRPDLTVSEGPSSVPATFRVRSIGEQKVIGVGYRKGSGWQSGSYIPSRKNILQDYREMREAGINTVRITAPGIYAHNLIGLAEETGLRVIYNFWIPDNMDFHTDTVELKELEASIIGEVRAHKRTPAILHWNLDTDVLAGLANFHPQPVLEEQRQAYFDWISRLAGSIRTEDEGRPVYHTLNARTGIQEILNAFPILDANIDKVGLRVGAGFDPEYIEDLMTGYGDRVVLSDIEVDELKALPVRLASEYVVLSNWQNEWRATSVSFDGLKDFNGRSKPALWEWEAYRTGNAVPADLPTVRILPPAKIPYPGEMCTYSAVLWHNGEWVPLSAGLPNIELEWSLVKKDGYGHPIALKMLGTGPRLRLKFPPQHLRYEIRLTVSKGLSATSVRRPLLPK